MLIIRDLFTPFLVDSSSCSLAYSDFFWKSVEKSFANFVIDRNGVWELQQKLQVFSTSTVDWNEISVWMLNLGRLNSYSSFYQRFTNHQNNIVFHLILSFCICICFPHKYKHKYPLQLKRAQASNCRIYNSDFRLPGVTGFLLHWTFSFLISWSQDIKILISRSVLHFLDLDTYWTSRQRFCRPSYKW